MKRTTTTVAGFIRHHLTDKNLTHTHRCFFGVIIGMFGVVISGAMAAIPILSHIGHWLGYLIHGLGCVPFLNVLAPEVENETL